MAGYSQKPLPQKLGIKPGMRIQIAHAPAGYAKLLGALPKRVRLVTRGNDIDLIQYFCRQRQALASVLPGLKSRMTPSGAIWISWPKRSSGSITDLDENVVRHLALQQRLVDVKVVAINETWSGLKLVIPKRFRG